jgi:hypothetical protein
MYAHDTEVFQPDADTLFSFGSPQPFVSLYAVVLGKGGHVFMNIICIVALWLVRRLPLTLPPNAHSDPYTEHSHRHRRRLASRLRRRP